MSILIRNQRQESDTFLAIEDDSALPSEGPVLVSWTRWQRDREVLIARAHPWGVRLPNTLDVGSVDEALLSSAALIVLEFPSFADGRAYSQARLLREARHFGGELRAVGAAVVRDQLLGMVRCGIDSFLLRADQSASACSDALRDFSLAYQPAIGPVDQVRALRRESTPKLSAN